MAESSKPRSLPAWWVVCENAFTRPSSPAFGAGVIDLLREGAVRGGLTLLFCGPRLCAIGDERSCGLTGGRARSACGRLEVSCDGLAYNQPTLLLGSVSATPVTSQLLTLGLLPPSSAAQGDACSMTTQHTRTQTPLGRPMLPHPMYARSQVTLRLPTVSLERWSAPERVACAVAQLLSGRRFCSLAA